MLDIRLLKTDVTGNVITIELVFSRGALVSFWVEPMFNGVTLLVAIGIAGYAQRRKTAAQ